MRNEMRVPSPRTTKIALLAACVLAFGFATACVPVDCDDCGDGGYYHHRYDRGDHNYRRDEDRGYYHGGGDCDNDDYACR